MRRAQRNALAELILAALREPAACEALRELQHALREVTPVEVSRSVAAHLGETLVSASPTAAGARIVASPALAAVSAEASERIERALAAWRDLQRARASGVEPAATPTDLDASVRRAAALFDARLYFEVHEELEVQWRAAAGETRRVLQGLVQAAVALHHAEAGNLPGMQRLLAAARAKLTPHGPSWRGVAIAQLLQELDTFERAVSRHDRVRAPRLIVT